MFTNLAKPGLRIVKYDRQSHRPMSGVSFDLYRDGAFIGRYETDAAGEIVLNNIEPGTYRAVEVDTGDDSHILDDSSHLEVELEAGDGIKELVFFNDVLPGMTQTVTLVPNRNATMQLQTPPCRSRCYGLRVYKTLSGCCIWTPGTTISRSIFLPTWTASTMISGKS